MAALTGTRAQTIDLYPGSGTVNNMYGIVANAAETIAWCVDRARGEIQKITGIGTTLANVVLTTGLTSPVAIALSDDELTLYVLELGGLMKSVNVTSGVATQIGTLAAISTAWRYMRKGVDGYLYCQSTDLKGIHRYSLASNTGSLFLYFPYWASGLAFNTAGTQLYTFICTGGPNSTGILCRHILAQGRWEVVAGTGTAANTNGEAFLVAAFDTAGDIAVDSTDGIIYAGADQNANGRLCTINAGSVSRINVNGDASVRGGIQGFFWMLKTANKLLVANGSTAFHVIT